MGLIDLFSELKGPIFIKEDSDAERQLEYLKTLPSTPEVEKEIKLVEAGIIGEKNIRFELENGHIHVSFSSFVQVPEERLTW